MNNNLNNISSLDFFRGVAGYGVAICHFYYYLHGLDNFQIYSIFFVEFFFVLSGFVLYPQLQKVYNNAGNIKIFYLRRWIRTIPPYLLALVCFSILFSKYDSDTLKYLFFIQKISPNFVNFDYFSVAWSLSVEEFFYFIFPIFLILFNKRKFVYILILFILLIYILKIIYLFLDTNVEFYRIGTFLRLDAIAFGVLTRIYLEKIKNNYVNIFSLILIAAVLNYFFIDIKNLNIIDSFLIVLLTQFFSINMIIIFINFNKLIQNKKIEIFFSLLAKQTYSIYLFHFVVIYFISVNNLLLNNQLIFIFYLIFLFLFSTIFYYIFEKGFIESRPTYKLKQ